MTTRYSNCTILRIKLERHGHFSCDTGEIVFDREETVTEACGTPLFGAHTQTGICRSCERGWEVEGNRFANQTERDRATGKDRAPR